MFIEEILLMTTNVLSWLILVIGKCFLKFFHNCLNGKFDSLCSVYAIILAFSSFKGCQYFCAGVHSTLAVFHTSEYGILIDCGVTYQEWKTKSLFLNKDHEWKWICNTSEREFYRVTEQNLSQNKTLTFSTNY